MLRPSQVGFPTAAVLRTNWRHEDEEGEKIKGTMVVKQTQLKKMRKSKIGSICFVAG